MDVYEFNDKLAVNAFIKFVIKRSAGSVTCISIPDCCTEEAFRYVADECPDLRVLLLPLTPDHDYRRCYQPYDYLLNIPSLVRSFQMEEVLAQINIHCKNFIGLDITKADIGDFEASAIVTLLPNIKQLYLRNATMEKEHLVMILKGCKELEYVDVSKCIGFDYQNANQVPVDIKQPLARAVTFTMAVITIQVLIIIIFIGTTVHVITIIVAVINIIVLIVAEIKIHIVLIVAVINIIKQA
ncbi:hypothetical protein HYC85_019654 [Camellia sinensis]|uniref:Uncharacterized protein n=1 Tax=Camellia sinensis TaxID=4442 RepID=A0A7J7GMJ0_CAMSI|nr:hypothetical protein HYC85_019654 [Camellia sinensis]